MLAGFVNTTERADGERGVESSRKPFAGNIADIKADGAITEGEIIEIVTSDLGGGLKFVRDGDLFRAQGVGSITFWMVRASSRSCSRSFQWNAIQAEAVGYPWDLSGGENRTVRGTAWREA